MSGAELEKLKADVAAVRPGPVQVRSIGKTPPAGGPTAAIVMPFVSGGSKVTEFPLYDGYFKVAFTVVEELRALGFDAALAPAIWAARDEATRFELQALDDPHVEDNLAATNAQESVPGYRRLTPAQKRDLLVSRLVYVSARSALPPERAREQPTPREIRGLYFASGAGGPPKYELVVDVLELDERAEGPTVFARKPVAPTGTARPGGARP
ncbi:MAG TPA: hypothetical protein VHF22_08115, partial [Planctomycetota bacterium]|nr:hypothetical protein [Planctomycetota bacterium]